MFVRLPDHSWMGKRRLRSGTPFALLRTAVLDANAANTKKPDPPENRAMNRSTLDTLTMSFRSALLVVAVLSAALLTCATRIAAQEPAAKPSASAQPVAAQISTTQADKEWLTAYMLAHEGYRLDHLDALEDKFSKMSPTQLGTLRNLYEMKHQAMMQQQQLFHRAQAQQFSWAEAETARQQQLTGTIGQEETSAANLEEQQLNQMHQEAAANAMQKSSMYPYGVGGYPASPYGYHYGYPMVPVPLRPYGPYPR